MSLRLEEKISNSQLNIFAFKKWLEHNNAKIIFPKRIINSIYFDNNFKLFDQSVEGIVPRKKIRLRTYGTEDFFSSQYKYKKEIKYTFFNYRSKEVKNYNFNFEIFRNGLYETDVGICKANLNVIYTRSYFEIFGTRITIDEDIKYRGFVNNSLSKFIIREKQPVIEIKSSNIGNRDYLNHTFPIQRVRFSKYCRGVELFYNL